MLTTARPSRATAGPRSTANPASKSDAPGPAHAAAPATAPAAPLPAFAQAGLEQMLHAGAIRAKLTVGSAGDPAEREADLVAERVTSAQTAAPSPPCACGGAGSCACGTQPEVMRRQTATGADPHAMAVPDAVLPRGGGSVLEPALRSRLEAHLGVDLSPVRVHTGTAAQTSARLLGARAFTHRSDIFIGAGERADDPALMAHEATHVAQQAPPGSPAVIRRSPVATTNDGAAPRSRILARIHEELGDDAPDPADAEPAGPHGAARGTPARPRPAVPAAGAPPTTPAPAPAAPAPGAAPGATPQSTAHAAARSTDRREVAEKKAELLPAAHPDIDRPAVVGPQVRASAQQTATVAEAPTQPPAGVSGAAKAPPAKGHGGGKTPLSAADRASGAARNAFAAASAVLPPIAPAPVVPARPVAPIDKKGAPVVTDPAHDAALDGVAVQAQTLRDAGTNLLAHAAEERANAATLSGNLHLVDQGVAQAATGIKTSHEHLSYRREVATTAHHTLTHSKEVAQSVADQAPGFAADAAGGKERSGPMASEAADMSAESEANKPDDPDAAESANEQGGKIAQAQSDIGKTDDAITKTQERAASLQRDAAHAAELNTATEQRMASVDAKLEATETRLGEMDRQHAEAAAASAHLASQPAALLRQAAALEAQGQGMIDASTALEGRLRGAQDSHEAALGALPEIRPAPLDDATVDPGAPVDAGADPNADPNADGGNPEDYRYEDRASVDLGSHLPSWFSGADPVSEEQRATAEQAERDRRAREVQEITDMAGGDVATIGPGQRAAIALRMTGRHLFGAVGGIRWPGWGHLALGLIDPRGPLMGVVSGLSMMLSGGANLFSAQQWRRDPLGNLLKSAADIATGLTIILGSITALAGVIIAIMGAITILSLGTAAPITGPIIAFCASVMATVGGWTIAVGEVALVLQGLVLIKNLIDAACATNAQQLQNQSDKLTSDVSSAGNVVLQMGMAKLAQVGGRGMQTEIGELGSVGAARAIGGRATAEGAGNYARALGGAVRSAPGRLAGSVGSLASREGRSAAWRGIRSMVAGGDHPPLSARQGFSRDFLTGEGSVARDAAAARDASAAAPAAHPPATTDHVPPAAADHAPPPAADHAPPPAAADHPPPPVADHPPPAVADHAPPPADHAPPPAEHAPPADHGPETLDQRVARSGREEHISPAQVDDELRHIGEDRGIIEGAPPNRRARIGDHEWREGPDGRWCRYSAAPTVCAISPPPGVMPAPQPTLGDLRNEADALRKAQSTRALTDAEQLRLGELDGQLASHYVPGAGETPAQIEARLFGQRPGETLAQWRQRMQGLRGEVERATLGAHGDPAIMEQYERILATADQDAATLAQKTQDLQNARDAYARAQRDWDRARAYREGRVSSPPETSVSTRHLDELAATRRRLESEVRALESRGAARSSTYQYDDVGRVPPCFAAGTPVAVPGGVQTIETLLPGAAVLAFDVARGAVVPGKVVQLHANWTESFVHLGFGGTTVRATREHPFWVDAQQAWVPAYRLVPGTSLRGPSGPVVLESAEIHPADAATFNVEVEAAHCYFVGTQGALVHNAVQPPRPSYADLTKRTTRIYQIVETLPNGTQRTIYIGKTYQGNAGDVITRFEDHLGVKPDWAALEAQGRLKPVMLQEGQWTAFETAVWEQHYINQFSALGPIENDATPLTRDAWNRYRANFQGC